MAAREIRYDNNIFLISYDIVHPTNTKSIVILHGWGSNKEIMKKAFGALLPKWRHIYIDMPGFGKSTNPTILTTEKYSQILTLFLEEIGVKPMVVVGHSFGGKVATLLNPECLILLSSSGILVPKSWSIKAKIAIFKLLKPFGFGKIRNFFISSDAKGMNHEMYETFKNVVNEDFENSFANFKNKALLFWGKDDTATPLWTAKKISTLIENTTLYPLDGGHYFFLEHVPFITEIITKTCKEQH